MPDWSTGLQVLDISSPANPTNIGGCGMSGNALGVAVNGSYAYVADSDAGLEVIDIRNPAAPVAVGGHDTGGTALAVAVGGQYAYVADGIDGLQVIDISKPTAPVSACGGDCFVPVIDCDSDQDGVSDCYDACPWDPAKVCPGECGCGVPDTPGCMAY
jgi:hypothetical protein